MRKPLFYAAGVSLGVLGVIGLVLPVVPGVLLLAGSAACFARASQS
jgi:uncharacterized membrane protein YbaN (DUF454 family)